MLLKYIVIGTWFAAIAVLDLLFPDEEYVVTSKTPDADLRFDDQGSIWTLTPISAKGSDWIDGHISDDARDDLRPVTDRGE
jgi:hypothetical protein